MSTDSMWQGLQIFAIGFGGVFLALTVIWLSIAVLGRVLGRVPEKDQPEP